MKKLLFYLIIFLPVMANAQILDGRSMVRPGGPALSTNVGSLSGFSTTIGVASASQSFTVSGANLIAGAHLAAPTNWEISLDNSTFTASVDISQSGAGLAGQPVPVYNRITTAAPSGAVSGNVTITSTSATPILVGLSGTVNVQTLTTSVSSLSGFSTTAGTASASQSFTLSGANLTAGAALTAPASFEISLDNSTFAGSLNVSQSGGSLVSQPVSIFNRIASSASAGSPTGNVHITSTGAAAKDVTLSGTVTGGGSKDSVKFNLSLTSRPVTGWVNIVGDPSLAILTGSGGITNAITFTSVATANWKQNGGACAEQGLGQAGGTFFDPNVMLDFWFMYSGTGHASDSVNVGLGSPQIRIGGLSSSATYTIKMTGSLASTVVFASNNKYRIVGAATYISPLFNTQTNTANGVTFTNVQPDGSGNIKLYFFTEVGQEACVVSGFTIVQN